MIFPKDNIRLCITGGSGFIGTNAIEWAKNNNITIMNIDIRNPKNKNHTKFFNYVDIRDINQLKNALDKFNPTHIIHLAATTGMGDYDISYFDANTIGVKNIISASNQLNDLERIIFTSSLLVCKNGYIPKSDTEFCPPNTYGESKVIGEKFVRNESIKPWVIVRPTSIWGPWFETSYFKFFQTINKGMYMNPGKDPIYKPLSYVGNTVYMIEKLLFSKTDIEINKVFYLADYPYISVQDWSRLIRKAFGKKTVFDAPIPILKIMALIGDALKYTGVEDPPITSFRLKNILTGAYYPIDNTKEIVGDLPYSTEMGVNNTVNWINNNL